MSKNFFNGFYYKHQKDRFTIAFIPSIANGKAGLQVVTNDNSEFYEFENIHIGDTIVIGDCTFSKSGITINLPTIKGALQYEKITPLKSDIMGFYKWLPMQCRHSVVSMHHKLHGSLVINGETVDFTGGTGYIEGDCGTSFPKKYTWLQCNDFNQPCSIMVAVAHIPIFGTQFTGCICAIIYAGREYRIASYKGAKILKCNKNQIVLTQGKYRLYIDVISTKGVPLKSPIKGEMIGIVHENNSASARFRFFEHNQQVFDLRSKNTAFEQFVK